MLSKLCDAGLIINADKCEMLCSSVKYLGFVLDQDGLRTDPDKIAPVVNYPAPENVKQLRRFRHGRMVFTLHCTAIRVENSVGKAVKGREWE